jgi:TRAP-type uncharacterized transport system substrate-binding protein
MVCMFRFVALASAVVGLVFATNVVTAADRIKDINNSTVGLMAGEPEWLPLVQDVAKTINHREGLRILPIAGEGGIQSVSDLMNINGVDVALIPADSVAYAKAQGLVPPDGEKIAYLARIGSIKVLLLARGDITGLTSLAGKRIATGPAQSSGFATGELILGALGLPFTRVPTDGAGAIAALERGEADAALVLGIQNLAVLKKPAEYRVISLPLPKDVESHYSPAIATEAELQRFGIKGGPVDTVSTPLILAVFNWSDKSPNSETLYSFNKALLDAANLPDSDALWIKNNLAADVPNMLRHHSAQRALEESSPAAAAAEQGVTQ